MARLARRGRSAKSLRRGQTTAGYWQRPQQTADALRDGWFWTGDLAYADAQGYLYIVDRAKDMIISGGENVYSAEVEAVAATHPAVQEVAIIGLTDERWGERVNPWRSSNLLRTGRGRTARFLP